MLYEFYFIPSYRDQGYVHVVLNEGCDCGPNVFAHACTMKFMHAVNGRKYLLIDDHIVCGERHAGRTLSSSWKASHI